LSKDKCFGLADVPQQPRAQSRRPTSRPLLVSSPYIRSSDVTGSVLSVNKTGSARVTRFSVAFVQPLLLRKSNKYYILRGCVCSLRYPACSAHAPYYALLPSMASPALPCFPTLPQRRHDFGQKLVEHKMSVLIFSNSA